MTQRIYTLGYTGRSIDEIASILDRLNAVLVDIRFSPGSFRPEFRHNALRARFGERYRWAPELGNVNYKNGQGIKIRDFDKGAECLLGIQHGDCALLMCACQDPRVCHRTVVARMLRERGFSVEEVGRE